MYFSKTDSAEDGSKQVKKSFNLLKLQRIISWRSFLGKIK